MAFSHLLDQLGGDQVFDAVNFRLIGAFPAAHFPICRLTLGQALAAVGDACRSIRFDFAAVPEIGLVGGEFFRAAGHDKLVGGLCLQASGFGFPTENQGIAGGVTFQVGGGDAEAGDDWGVDVFLAFGQIDVLCQVAHGYHGAAFVLEVLHVSLEQLEAGGAVGVAVRHAVVNKHADFPTARLAEFLATWGEVAATINV